MNITVLGSGAWGTALAYALSKNGDHDILLYGKCEDEINDINNVTLTVDDGVTVDKTNFSKEDLVNNKLTQVVIPATGKSTLITATVERGDPKDPWFDDFNMVVRAKAEGFVMAYDDMGAFNEDPKEYGKVLTPQPEMI